MGKYSELWINECIKTEAAVRLEHRGKMFYKFLEIVEVCGRYFDLSHEKQ
jgi:hypothetical protein